MSEALQTVDPEELVAKLREKLFCSSLVDLVAERETMNGLVSQLLASGGAGAVPDDVWETLQAVDDVVAGKVDRVAERVKVTIPAYLGALRLSYEAQLGRAEVLQVRLESLLREAVLYGRAKGRSALHGERYRLRMQTNGGQASVKVEDERKVPSEFKRVTFKMSCTYSAGDEHTDGYWHKLVAMWKEEERFSFSFETSVDTKAVAAAWEAQKGVEADKRVQVSGTAVSRGEGLRIEPGKADMAAKPLMIEPSAADTQIIEAMTMTDEQRVASTASLGLPEEDLYGAR